MPQDIRKPNPFQPCRIARFDAIISGYCIDSATNTIEDYEKALSNIPPMLNKNGAFVFIGAINQSSYSFGDCKFKTPTYSKDELYRMCEKYGLLIEYFDDFQNEPRASDDGSIYIAVAKKSVD